MKRLAALLLIALLAGAGVYWASGLQSRAAHPVATAATSSPGTAAPAAPQTTPSGSIAALIAGMTLREKVEGLLILHTPGTDPAKLMQYVNRYHPAGVILMEDNIPSNQSALRNETAAVQKGASVPYFIAIDEEGCSVKRLASDTFACAPQLKNAPVASTSAAFAARSALLRSDGITVNFGIVADITADPSSFIYPRVFGSDPELVAPRIAAAVEASTGGTLSTLKHFPGHGETPANSHVEIPVATISQAQWAQKDKLPFQAGVVAGADLVMFGQLSYSAVDPLPATLSPAWHRILVNDMGFNGLAVTDDMIMLQQSGVAAYKDPVNNAVASLQAGSDLLLYVNDHGTFLSDIDVSALIDGIVAAVQGGKLTESEIDRKLEKVLLYRQRAASF